MATTLAYFLMNEAEERPGSLIQAEGRANANGYVSPLVLETSRKQRRWWQLNVVC